MRQASVTFGNNLAAMDNLATSRSLDPLNPRDPAVAKLLGLGRQNTAAVEITPERVVGLPAVKRAIQIICDKMFGMPWYVFEEQEDGREFDISHPAWHCIHLEANSHISAPAMRQQLTQWALTYGNGCAYIDRSNPAKYELLPLLPDRTSLVQVTREMGEKIGDPEWVGRLLVKSMIGNEYRYFPKQDVLHIKGLGPNPYWGWDLHEILKECFAGAIATDEFANRFFSNGANPVGFVQMEGSLDEEEEETYLQSLSQAMSGLGKAHKVVLLEEGAKFTPTTIDPQKSQLLEGKQFDVRKLAMAIGIKVHKLIDGANSAFASLEQANHEHKDDDIMPWVNKFRVEYCHKLLSTEQLQKMTHSIDLDDEALDWIPFADRATGTVELYNNGLITKEEGRRKLNFGPSRSSRGKQFRIPANIIFEDDITAGETNSTPDDTQKDSNPTPEESSMVAASERNEVEQFVIQNIEKRVRKQALVAATKSDKDFVEWLDSLKTDSVPKAIQPQVNDFFDRFRKEMNEVASKATNQEELKGMLQL